MTKAVLALILTLVAGILGVFIDAATMDMQGNFGAILAIATMGAFIISSLEKKDTK